MKNNLNFNVTVSFILNYIFYGKIDLKKSGTTVVNP